MRSDQRVLFFAGFAVFVFVALLVFSRFPMPWDAAVAERLTQSSAIALLALMWLSAFFVGARFKLNLAVRCLALAMLLTLGSQWKHAYPLAPTVAVVMGFVTIALIWLTRLSRTTKSTSD